MNAHDAASQRAGLLFGLTAHACWGLMPLYVALLPQVGPLEFLAHRVFWSAAFLLLILGATARLRDLIRIVRMPGTLGLLLLSSVLIVVNWYVFLYGVSSRQSVQNSLGYYTNPLCNVVLGVFLLGERLRPGKWLALAFATGGIGYLMWTQGQVPWIALFLAWSFAFYGLVRKLAAVDGAVGMAFEMLLMAGPSAAIVWLGMKHGTVVFGQGSLASDAVLILSGPVTVIPLLCFVLAARRLPMTTLGFLQYVGPTMQLLTAIFVFGEAFGRDQWIGFGLIWVALILVMGDTLLGMRKRQPHSMPQGATPGSEGGREDQAGPARQATPTVHSVRAT
ncbi:MAG: EamA family transporter RarD [Gemmataceae bacterium]